MTPPSSVAPSDSPCVADLFWAPLQTAFARATSTRVCPAICDWDFVANSVLRVAHDFHSGRHFLQTLDVEWKQAWALSTYFLNLQSSRRGKLVQELDTLLNQALTGALPDALAAYASLAEFDVYAGDGHFLERATHDPRPKDATASARGFFFCLNLRNHLMGWLEVEQKEGTRQREHDMHMLKRLTREALRRGAPAGRKVLWVWDRAGVDLAQWQQWKNQGIYFISRTKENIHFKIESFLPWDPSDPMNKGVVNDESVRAANGGEVRRVTYLDPISGQVFEFLTTLRSVPPGLISLLYRLRWDIEKCFDETKNKLAEKKAWATGAQAQRLQGLFIALTHNLMLALDRHLEQEHEVRHVAEEQRRQKRAEQRRETFGLTEEELPASLRGLWRASQRCLKFIRWLRSELINPSSLDTALAVLRRLYARL